MHDVPATPVGFEFFGCSKPHPTWSFYTTAPWEFFPDCSIQRMEKQGGRKSLGSCVEKLTGTQKRQASSSHYAAGATRPQAWQKIEESSCYTWAKIVDKGGDRRAERAEKGVMIGYVYFSRPGSDQLPRSVEHSRILATYHFPWGLTLRQFGTLTWFPSLYYMRPLLKHCPQLSVLHRVDA